MAATVTGVGKIRRQRVRVPAGDASEGGDDGAVGVGKICRRRVRVPAGAASEGE